MNYTVNCTVREELSKWVTVAACEQVIICFVGAICNSVSIWCLVRCQKTGPAVKLLLICICSLQLAVCITTLPFISYLYYTQFFCLETNVPKEVQFAFSMLNSILLQGERLNFMVMAVFRLVAVACPRVYKKHVTRKLVCCLQGSIFVIIVPPWIALGITQSFSFSRASGSVMRLHFEKEGAFVMALYGIYYCFPFVVTFAAYALMMISIIRQNRHVKLRIKKRTTNMDHVASTIRIVILTNILLDGPHVVVHLLRDYDLACIVTHMAFFLHIVLDPIIFVGMNQVYRKEVLRKLCGWLPKVSESFGLHSCTSKDTDGHLDDRDVRGTWREAERNITDKRNAVYLSHSQL